MKRAATSKPPISQDHLPITLNDRGRNSYQATVASIGLLLDTNLPFIIFIAQFNAAWNIFLVDRG
jgi:hypothetical protein